MSYFIRLLANLNENTMVNLAAPHLLAFLGLLTCGMMMYLSILIFRADPTNPKNRFLSFILAFEGFGAGALNFFGIFPFPVEYLDFLYSVRYVSGSTGMIRLIFYICIIFIYSNNDAFGSVRRLFASRSLWLSPLIGFIIFVSTVFVLGGEVSALGDMYALECNDTGEGKNVSYGDSDFMFNTTCPASLEPVYPLTITKIGIGTLQPILVPITALALLFSTIYLYRIDADDLDETSAFDAKELRAIRFGFLTKLIFSGGATVLIILANSLVNSGELQGSDIIQDDLFFSAFQSTTLFMNIFGSFMMGVFFAYAILKQDVLGIDEQLRRTFTGTIFASLGAFLFIAGTEVMESATGVGWVGAVGMGTILVATRKPILSSISAISNRLLPEVHTKDETAYLELYKLAIEDGKITQKERTMLMMQAKVYGLQDKRVEHLEAWYKDNIASDDVDPEHRRLFENKNN